MSKAKGIKDIEQQYDVASICYKNLNIWPVLRYYICVKHSTNKSSIRPSIVNLSSLIRSFFYGLKYYFFSCDYLFISSSDQRKSTNGVMIDKSIDKIARNLNESWIVELPSSNHTNRRNLLNKRVSSKIPLILWTRIYAKLFVNNSNIKNEKILSDLLEELGVDFNAKNLCKRIYAEYRVMKFLAKRKNIKAAFVVCHYTNMGYIKALKDLNIPVFEIQHGVITRNHCAYNLYSDSDTSFYPDYLLTYGEREKNISKRRNRFIKEEKIIPVGHGYLEFMASEYKGDDNLKSIISNYKYSIAVVSQNHPVEDKLIDFIKKSANENSDTLYIFIPRNFDKTESSYAFPENIKLFPYLNVYETIWHADIHATVFSTLALEAPAIGKPNILIDIDNLSKEYLGEFLLEGQINKYVNNISDFNQAKLKLSLLSQKEVISSYDSVIKPNYEENIEHFVNEYIK